MHLSKEKILSLVRKNLSERAMDFDTPDRPEQGIQQKLSTGETPLKKIPFPQTGDQNKNFQELLASRRYREVLQRLRQYTGIQTPLSGDQRTLMPYAQTMMSAHNEIVRTEAAHKPELEKLAIEVAAKEMGIGLDGIEFEEAENGGTLGKTQSFNFIAKIVGMGEIDTDDFNKQAIEQQQEDPVDVEKELFTQAETFNMEKAKRRLINSIIQGASKKGHYMYNLVPEKVREITGSDSLMNKYGILMSVNDTLYWQLSDEMMQAMMGGGQAGGVGGKMKTDLTSDPPTIYAEGVNFPVLIHELLKGILEMVAYAGDTEDRETQLGVEASEDTLQKEAWDMRLGPVIWDILYSNFPDEIVVEDSLKEIKLYVLQALFKLPAKSFLVFTKEVLSETENGRRLMRNLIDGVRQQLNQENAEDAIDQMRNELENQSDEISDEDLRDFLGDLGISTQD